MRVRYKNTGGETYSSHFNMHGLGEVLTEDDSVFISELDVYVNGDWKDMQQAFRDKDLISDNYFTWFRESRTEEERQKGYF